MEFFKEMCKIHVKNAYKFKSTTQWFLVNLLNLDLVNLDLNVVLEHDHLTKIPHAGL